jgi:hypothetical protein
MTESNKEPMPLPWSSPVKSTLALSALTLLGYGCAFSFQWGYLGGFGVPLDLIDVGIRESLLCAAVTLALLLIAFFALGFVPAKRWLGLLWQLMPLAGMAMIMWATAFYDVNRLGESSKVWFGISAVLFAVGVVYNLVRPLRQRSGPLLDRFHAEALAAKDPIARSVTRAVIDSVNIGGFPLGSVAVVFSVVVVIIGAGYFSVGYVMSKAQLTYELVEASQPCIVVAKNAETLVCAELTPSRRMLTGAIVLIKPDAARPLRMRSVFLGHLRSAVDPSR